MTEGPEERTTELAGESQTSARRRWWPAAAISGIIVLLLVALIVVLLLRLSSLTEQVANLATTTTLVHTTTSKSTTTTTNQWAAWGGEYSNYVEYRDAAFAILRKRSTETERWNTEVVEKENYKVIGELSEDIKEMIDMFADLPRCPGPVDSAEQAYRDILIEERYALEDLAESRSQKNWERANLIFPTEYKRRLAWKEAIDQAAAW